MPSTSKQATDPPRDQRIAKAVQTRQRIVDAATELFLADGYSSTSLDNVASQAGVTKPTVYSHFKSKEGLLESVIGHFTSRPLEELTEFLRPSSDPRFDLIRFGDFFMTRTFAPDALAWKRLATAEATTYPEVGAALYEAGPARLLRALAKYFAQQTRAGRLSIRNTDQAAEQFLGMLVGLDLLRSQIGQPLPTSAKRKRRCRDSVDLFLSSYGPNCGGKSNRKKS